SEVLFRTNAQIYAARTNCSPQSRNHALISGFIGQEVIRTEVTAGFRKIRNHGPEFTIAEARWKRVCNCWRSASYVQQNGGQQGQRYNEQDQAAKDFSRCHGWVTESMSECVHHVIRSKL